MGISIDSATDEEWNAVSKSIQKANPKVKVTTKDSPDYKYSEDTILDEIIKPYIEATYRQHYAAGKYQATDMIIDAGHGEGFCMGNVMKYAMRYGKKDGKNNIDLLKIIHYAMIAFYLNNKSEK
tara:strand:+ start:640 stop:1011 length:372 start_codon:yes stop_codon:yes gene_type:complete